MTRVHIPDDAHLTVRVQDTGGLVLPFRGVVTCDKVPGRSRTYFAQTLGELRWKIDARIREGTVLDS